MSSTPEEAGKNAEDPDALRAQVRQIAAEKALTLTAIAKEASIPLATFSAWLNGSYQGNNDKIAAQAQRWLHVRAGQVRARAVLPTAPGFVLTPTAAVFLGALEHAQHAPDLVLLTGGAGVGKTSAFREYQGSNSSVWLLTAEPCFATPRMLLDDLAETLGVGERGSSQRMSKAIVQRLRDTAGLLIVDEAQHLGSASLDQLRTLHDLAGVGVALGGNETVYGRIEGTSRSPNFAQLFSRVGMRVQRPASLPGDIDALLDAWSVEGRTERGLLRAIGRKPGALRVMTKTLRSAHMQARADDAEAPTERHIRLAWTNLASSPLGDGAAS